MLQVLTLLRRGLRLVVLLRNECFVFWLQVGEEIIVVR